MKTGMSVHNAADLAAKRELYGPIPMVKCFYTHVPTQAELLAMPGVGQPALICVALDPAAILAGIYDAAFKTLGSTWRADWGWHLVLCQEPDQNDRPYTAAQFLAAQAHVAKLCPLGPTCLTGYSLDKATNYRVNAYTVATSKRMTTFDIYPVGTPQGRAWGYEDPMTLLAPAFAWASLHDRRWGLSEFGTHGVKLADGTVDVSGRPAWIERVASEAKMRSAWCCLYFTGEEAETGSFRIDDDPPSVAAMRRVMGNA